MKIQEYPGVSCTSRWWSFKYFLFSPLPLGRWSNLITIFLFKGLVKKPPTSSANPTRVRMGLRFRNTWTMKMAFAFLAHDASMGLAYSPVFTICLPLRNNHSCVGTYTYVQTPWIRHGYRQSGNTFNPRSLIAKKSEISHDGFPSSKSPRFHETHPFCWFSGEQIFTYMKTPLI